ncbi:helix-turn-helix domain-containing protein [Bacillus sp. TH30]|uniref:helix-turn-helix domain-containing protein n=1 Tax=Bacillus sp. TH30 TaxID=2796395 RepID=UPI001911B892|nr:helix-turn-helix transcriptional regulator [Bacillus sp. TH30]MBK5424373.1 helix-turn-helix transcriptional regulator [Bacillus sp. TH30]
MNYERVAKNLINLRNEKSREEVARAVGISVSTLQMYENGQRIPRDNIKIKLANFYGVTVQIIFLIRNNTKCVE